MVSLPLPPSSLSCFFVPWIGVVWSWLWMTNLPLIFGQPLWLIFAVAAGAASRGRAAKTVTMRTVTTYLGSAAEQLGQDRPHQRSGQQPGADGEKPRLPDGLHMRRVRAVRPRPQRATGDPHGAADAKHRVGNPVLRRLVHDTRTCHVVSIGKVWEGLTAGFRDST